MKKLIQILWKLFLFTFPFSLHSVLYEKATYRFGNFNLWVTGILFLSEIFLFGIFFLQLFSPLRKSNEVLRIDKSETQTDFSFRPKWSAVEKSIPILLFLFLLNAALLTFWKGDLWLFGFFLFHLLAGGIFYRLMKAEIIPLKQSIRWLLFGALFQIIVAFFQVKLNHSLGLHFFGEPHLSSEILNVAKNNLDDGTKVIRGYGTFLHPNVLGVYLMTLLFVCLPHLKRFSLVLWPAILLLGIYLTGSRAAMLTTGVLLFLFLFFKFVRGAYLKKVFCFGILGLFLAINAWFFLNSDKVTVKSTSFAERIEQNVISQKMFKTHWYGVGVDQFTLTMEEQASRKLKPWNFQPVHNVYFLVLNETGFQGLLLLLLMIVFSLKAYFKKESESIAKMLAFFGLLIVASFDHLLWTSYMGPLLIGLVLSQVIPKTSK